jgi:hypothetical protein
VSSGNLYNKGSFKPDIESFITERSWLSNQQSP